MPQASSVRSAAQIRQEFLDFFRKRHGHTFAPSSSVVPHDDPTLLFTNAGMNQFKDVFLGHGQRPYMRAVNSQKCIRAGGKHNDLEDVGKDGYHHTFFEMLGNWSFGDYFKEEAIGWAWDLLTSVWGLDPERLYATVFEGNDEDGTQPDLEAETLWMKVLPPEQVSRWGKKDNFWEMGETGPCGPCSEVHYDGRSDEERARVPGADLVNQDHDQVIEIWNLVFIQFERGPGGLTILPAKHVDTGMGFERITRLLQGKTSNYDTDIWTPIFRAIEERTGAHPYGGSNNAIDAAYRVVADHMRCLTVAIADGARPGNEGRGYVLRRILRRAVRHAHQTLQTTGAWLHGLVPTVVDTLGDAFPEIRERADQVTQIVCDEEESFLQTLDRGIALFDEAAGRAEKGCIVAADAFQLHDTFGFPIDLTRVMAEERGISVDEAGYERLMEEARERSRRRPESGDRITLPAEAIARLKHLNIGPTRDEDKDHGRPVSARIRAIWNGTDFANVTHVGTRVAMILSRTNCYAEAGGQVADHGALMTDVFDGGVLPTRGFGGTPSSGDAHFRIEDVQTVGGYVLHIGQVVQGKLKVGDHVNCTIDRKRRAGTRANHTGTHLMNHALRIVVGEEVEQRGSLVAPDRLRFDFACSRALTPEQLEEVETRTNAAIDRDLRVYADVVPLEAARSIGSLRAVFGERYPDPVRVVSIGQPVQELLEKPDDPAWHDYSVELCGGTHLATAGEVKQFVIVSEQALAAGVRRMVALTGIAAAAAQQAGVELEARAAQVAAIEGEPLMAAFDELTRDVDEATVSTTVRHRVRGTLEALRDRIKTLRKSAQSAATQGVVEQARSIADGAGDASIVIGSIDGADKETLRSAMDVVHAKCAEAAVMLFAADPDEGKVAIMAVVPKPLIARGLKAGDWVRVAATVCGGGGGGRPDSAQAGGRDPSKVNDAIAAARSLAKEVLT